MDRETFNYMLTGIGFGITFGLIPGPLTSMIMSETMRKNLQAGIVVALTPIASEIPIVFISIAVILLFSDFHFMLGIMSLAGAFYLANLGISKLKHLMISQEEIRKANFNSFIKVLIFNLLNPKSYLFWITIGAPKVILSYNLHPLASVLFLLGFYGCFFCGKLMYAFIASKSKYLLSSRFFYLMNVILGLTLLVFALFFVIDALRFFQIL
jgi:threonine/homoserine/homoserine lactone efflux protein